MTKIPEYLEKHITRDGGRREDVRLVPLRKPDLYISDSEKWCALRYWEDEGIVAFHNEDLGLVAIFNSIAKTLQSAKDYIIWTALQEDHPRYAQARAFFDSKMNKEIEHCIQ